MCAALFPFTFSLLAQTATAPPDAATQNQAFVFLGGLVALAVMANQVMGAVISWRKMKGADPAEDRRYATKQEHNLLRDEVIGLKSEMSGLQKTITNEFATLNRSIGVLEGMLKKMGNDG